QGEGSDDDRRDHERLHRVEACGEIGSRRHTIWKLQGIGRDHLVERIRSGLEPLIDLRRPDVAEDMEDVVPSLCRYEAAGIVAWGLLIGRQLERQLLGAAADDDLRLKRGRKTPDGL